MAITSKGTKLNNSKMRRVGKANGRYKDGSRQEYRYKVGAKPNDGSVVHHKDGNRKNGAKSNLQKLTDGKNKPGRRTTKRHEQITKRAKKK